MKNLESVYSENLVQKKIVRYMECPLYGVSAYGDFSIRV